MSAACIHMPQGPSTSGSDQDARRACALAKALLCQGDVPGAVAVAQSLRSDVLKVPTLRSCQLWKAAKPRACDTAELLVCPSWSAAGRCQPK